MQYQAPEARPPTAQGPHNHDEARPPTTQWPANGKLGKWDEFGETRGFLMSGKWIGGKGDKPRPIKDFNKFSENWDNIFGKSTSRTSKKPFCSSKITQNNKK